MADGREYVSEHMNIKIVFYDVNLVLYRVHPMVRVLLKLVNVFHGENFVLFMLTSIHNILKSTKNKNSETRTQDGKGNGKQQKVQGSNRTKKRIIELINK